MGKTSDSLHKFADSQRQRRLLNSQIENQNFERSLKMADLQTKGFNIQETQTPRRLFGIPMGSQRSLTMSYTPPEVPEGFIRVGNEIKQNPAYLSPKDQAQTNYYNARAGQTERRTLTPGQQLAKDKATTEIFTTVEGNQPKRTALTAAQESLPKVPTGLMGKAKIQLMKWFDSNNPTLGDWQNLKSVLTDAQLMNTAKTKGAISDQEMRLFAQAAAQDDLVSISRMTPVLKRLGQFMDAEESGMMKAYEKNYGENPKEWFNGSQSNESGISEEDIQFTMQKHGISREEVLRRLNA